MDFTFTDTQADITKLAQTVFGKECTVERLQAVEQAGTGRFDAELWRTIATAGLVGLTVPEAHGGAGLGVLELTSATIEAGRYLAPVPLSSHLAAVTFMAQQAGPDVQAQWLPGAASGEVLVAAALDEPLQHAPTTPSTNATQTGDTWRLNGQKVTVAAGMVADLLAVSATTEAGPAVFLVPTTASGLERQAQRISDGSEVAAITFTDVEVGAEAVVVTPEAVAALNQLVTLARCAHQFGVVSQALHLTAEYAKSRHQFGRPIGTFQGVSGRLADGYIDVLGVELTLWEAAWRLNEGLDAAAAVDTVALWAAEAGHRLAHTTVHIHGGVGIDLDAEAHRFFTAAKIGEFAVGGANLAARRIGATLAQP